MATPKRKQKKFTDYLKWGVPAYLAVMYIVCQVVKTDSSLAPADRLDAGLARIVQKPFDIFPIDMKLMGVLLYVGLILMGFLYVEYVRRKQLRPGIESGSAAWNANLKEYNKTIPLKAYQILYRIYLLHLLYILKIQRT